MVVQLSDRLYEEAAQHAIAVGFPSVDEYVAEVVMHDLSDDPDNFDHMFTPERLAHIDKATAQIKAGDFYTVEQVREHFRQKRATWLQDNPN